MEENELSPIFLKISQILNKEEIVIWNRYRNRLWNKSDSLEGMSYFPSVDKGEVIREMHSIIRRLPIINKPGEIFYG